MIFLKIFKIFTEFLGQLGGTNPRLQRNGHFPLVNVTGSVELHKISHKRRVSGGGLSGQGVYPFWNIGNSMSFDSSREERRDT